MITGEDPLLAALADATQRKRQADHEIRLLLAYAQEISTPCPYQLADLAHAAGMPLSAIGTAYTQQDIVYAAHLRITGWDGPNLAWATGISSLLTEHELARERHGTTA
jgi:hypothetical protein